MDQNDRKRQVARAALQQVPAGAIIGVGTGSTTNHFIELLADSGHRPGGAVASSVATAERLREQGIAVLDLNQVTSLALYVDGADEVNTQRQMIKGGGGALTREKIVAAAAERFVCIVDDSKWVTTLGAFPLPIEVIPMARAQVARQLTALGGEPQLRADFTTDNGNVILDVYGLPIADAEMLEQTLNNIPGVVTNGLFARRPADLVLVGKGDEVVTL